MAPPLPGRRDGAGAPRRGAGAATGGGRHKGAPGGVPAEGPGGVGGPVLRPAGGGEAAGGRGTARRAHRSSGRCGSRPLRTRRRWTAWAKRRGRSAESGPTRGSWRSSRTQAPSSWRPSRRWRSPPCRRLPGSPRFDYRLEGRSINPFLPGHGGRRASRRRGRGGRGRLTGPLDDGVADVFKQP